MNMFDVYRNKYDGYFDELPKETQDIIRELLIEMAENRDGPEGWKPSEDCIDDIECRSRSGFIPFSHNKGGLTYRNFATLSDYHFGGYGCAHEKANKELERLAEYSIDCAMESFKEQYKDELQGIDDNLINYNDLYDMGKGNLAERLSELETESLTDENSTVMHEFRFMYHGVDDEGNHSASVSAAINLEAPYHRSHISWAPEVFCEGGKELEITWKTNKQLTKRLKDALMEVSKEVF